MECTDLDGNDYTDDEDYIGGGTPVIDPTVGTNTGSGDSGSQAPVIQTAPAPGGSYMVVAGDSSEEKHEVHHIVERCQKNKSGFTQENIEGYSNKVSIPKSVHNKISAYYSSKPNGPGTLRVRDMLAGKSFEVQYEYGMKILEQMWDEVFGK